ncbi:MAG TPA: hypothetical protein VHI71_10505 [Actinomycetota bacterium]|nr:hypothetical protein [Actinomycetota bacterium]
MIRGGSLTTDSRRLFAALVVSFALVQAFTFVPAAVGAPGNDPCDKPGAGNDKKCETPPPTPPPPTPTATPTEPPTETPEATPTPTASPGQTPAPSSSPTPSTSPSSSPTPSSSPAPTTSPGPTTSPQPSTSPSPTAPPTPSTPPTSTPVVTPPPPTEPPVITLPPMETQPPGTLPPEPTPAQTQPPGPVGPQPPSVDPTTEPLAPVETDDPADPATGRTFPFPPGGGGPTAPILEALSDLDELAGVVTDPKTAAAPEETAHAFGLRLPLGSSIGSLAATAGKAVQEFAFPLTLAIAVLLFLLFQGELDRRDPKLAYAPVDSTKDMVSFE